MNKAVIRLTILFSVTLLNLSHMKAQNNDYRSMIGYAVKAPSGHNTQPWLFRIGENKIEIHPDLSKALPVVDNNHRELFISIGCAAENLCIAASKMGYEPKMEVSDKGIITVWLKKSQEVDPNPLFDQIDRRQTNRNVYESRIVSDDTLSLCIPEIAENETVNIHVWDKYSSTFDTLKQAVAEGNVLQMGDESFKNELKSWMRFNKKHSESHNDGLSYAVFGAPNLPAFISKPAMLSYLNSKKQNKGDMKKIDSSSHFVLFTTKDNSIKEWITLGMYLQRFLLKTTEMGIACAYMNQPCEVESLAQQLQKLLQINNEYPTLLLRIGYAKPAPYSKRKNIDDVIIE